MGIVSAQSAILDIMNCNSGSTNDTHKILQDEYSDYEFYRQ